MKKITLLCGLLCAVFLLEAQIKPFRFIHITDTHIGSPNGSAEEDLRRTVSDINAMKDVAFVILTGDITELGTNRQLKVAKQILDSLQVKYYIIPGNHDSGWSESGGVSFTTTFGYDKFMFDYNGVRFIGCASGPYVRMSDGHIPRNAVVWLDEVLKKTDKNQPIIFANHYPLDNGLDNWYEAIDRLKQYNTILAICGHGHNNHAMNFEDIPAVMGRSNLRAKDPVGGYSLVDVRTDSIIYTERRPGTGYERTWNRVAIKSHDYAHPAKTFDRPNYEVNKQYAQVKAAWTYSSNANVISTPAVYNESVIFGNQNGEVVAVSLKNGKRQWSFSTNGSVFSSPAVQGDRVVLGSGDGKVYCLNAKNGKQLWSYTAEAAVLGCPLIAGDTVFIGGSDHSFMALGLNDGQVRWKFSELEGPVVSTPLLYEGRIVFGAWDRNLYALDRNDGKLLWKWNNGSSVINFSPASCIPVAVNGVVYVVAPDRTISAIDAQSGATLWRNKETRVRESIGISSDGKWIYGKTMQDTVVAYAASSEAQSPAWVMNAGFGYEHVPSMLIEKDGQVFFGTRSGVVYAIDPQNRKVVWAHKIDNSMVNTVRVLSGKRIIASTMDGKVALLEVR
ncbi:PQQ-binding-like beta-propeller repeat protein [Paraflavitalea sp. CAU 1676]|uniref:outer membrane protein assembly factor BamB family protein n=1 Tax=Paraflavitalea sp. CAU 1676 TaxID=3032598 RepID=UPI0023D9A806|nr:PQQ-binding-like beta-propeller repeat protein [Paraflavitalea sp. CAU 1676]MDF2187486.1 PQQ-binding-like beta-propeller repeat protein [Paraflavitalea sp. CAU 1676]